MSQIIHPINWESGKCGVRLIAEHAFPVLFLCWQGSKEGDETAAPFIKLGSISHFLHGFSACCYRQPRFLSCVVNRIAIFASTYNNSKKYFSMRQTKNFSER
ncbi:hypothetical protein [Massilia sp. MS-15]|uniref:hypothetical protein n=1 Tax=Massilia sp. MS-15 TaxID=2878200 RepID=UPI001CD2B3F0|nr:hypothetical protein [Massilia sp. MS-15]MCA1248720.1 hypothetical protein [Massilia sp. MS-15]